MAIEVRIPTILRTFTDGAKSVEAGGTTLNEVIDNLEANHPGIKDRLIDGGDLRRFVNVYVNDEDIRYLNKEATPLQPADTVSLVPSIAGGR